MSFNEELAIEIAHGILGWHKGERESGRFGSISIFKTLDINNLERIIFPSHIGFFQLATITIEIRRSRFKSKKLIGRKILKQRNGMKTILGDGELFYPDPRCIGVKPRIIMEGKPWLDLDKLFSLQDQTVKLFLIPSLLV